MIKSMTGFGRAEYTDGKRNITVEIKSVNHRYSDISVKMPRRYSFAEDRVKAVVKSRLKRGKVDVSIMVENITENDINIKLNEPIARQYFDNLKTLQDNFDLSGEITLRLLATMPDVMKAIPDVDDEEEIAKAILVPVEEAAVNLEKMRAVEGEKLLGTAEVRELFKFSKVGTIAGSYITDGIIKRDAKARLIRDGVVIYDGNVNSLQRGKDAVKEVKKGLECGITVENYADIKQGDIIEAYEMVEVKR